MYNSLTVYLVAVKIIININQQGTHFLCQLFYFSMLISFDQSECFQK